MDEKQGNTYGGQYSTPADYGHPAQPQGYPAPSSSTDAPPPYPGNPVIHPPTTGTPLPAQQYGAPQPAHYGAPQPVPYGAPQPVPYGAPPPGGYVHYQQPTSTNTVVIIQQPAADAVVAMSISRVPVNAHCPHCNQPVTTEMEYANGITVWIFCLTICFICPCLAFLPFVMDQCKDAIHHCPMCKREIGRYIQQRRGRRRGRRR